MGERLVKICVFYTRMAAYFWDCMEFASERYGLSFDVVMRRPSADAPLRFGDTPAIRVRYRDEVDDSFLRGLVREPESAATLVTGWTDRGYLCAVRGLATPTVCMVDNPYRGSLKQGVASWLFPVVKRQCFSHAWVTGRSAFELVRRLGFSEQEILSGLYSISETRFCRRCSKCPTPGRRRRLLYVGRFLDWKGVLDLADAFHEVSALGSDEWELHYYGRGEMKAAIEARASDTVVVNDFVSPDSLPALLHDADAVCVPSWDEHWGVVVHEAAMAGAPLICSDRVRAGEEFLIDGFNGWTFEAKSHSSLCQALADLMMGPQERLVEMSRRSESLARRHTVETWAAQLWSLVRPRINLDTASR